MTDGLKPEYRRAIIETLSANPKVERIVLFGSRAMGTFTPTSDIDLALFGDDLTLSDQAALTEAMAELSIPQRVDILIHHRIENQALREHIRIHGVEWFARKQAAGTPATAGVRRRGASGRQKPPACADPPVALFAVRAGASAGRPNSTPPSPPTSRSLGMASKKLVQQPVALLPSSYPKLLEDIKARIRQAQVCAALSVNRELVLLYWHIGKEILQRQEQEGWGAKVIDHLARDLAREFPEMKGFSPRNLKYMRTFSEAWPDEQIVQEALAQITWYHNITLLEKVKDPAERLWYAHQTIEHGWSRNVLVHQIESRLYERQGKAVTNFERTLPAPQSDLTQSLVKDPYIFDFLSLGPEVQERDLEQALLNHLRDFLLEMGKGFAFVGSQYRLKVGGDEFYIDLLFYQLRLRCYVVIELKVGEFKPEYAGKMNFYLSAVDDLLRHPEDRPSLGLILCKSQNRLVAEYALRDMNKPMGVATYRLTEALPADLQEHLPSIEELQKELGYGG